MIYFKLGGSLFSTLILVPPTFPGYCILFFMMTALEEETSLDHPVSDQRSVTGNTDSLSLVLQSDAEYLRISGVSKEEVAKIRKKTFLLTFSLRFTTAEKLSPWDRLSTGCHTIDSVLVGGFPINGISEVFGYSGVGKTQLGLQLALNVQLPHAIGGKEKGAVYICTEDAFPSKRYHQLAQSFKTSHNCTEIDFEGHTYLYHCADFEQLRKTLCIQLPRLLEVEQVGLVVLDSIAGPFRSDYTDVSYHNRGQHINEIARALHHIAQNHSIAVVCMNQVTYNQKEDVTDPCLGLVWGNNVTCRFYISRFGSNSTRTFETIFAPDLPNRKCCFTIDREGITAS